MWAAGEAEAAWSEMRGASGILLVCRSKIAAKTSQCSKSLNWPLVGDCQTAKMEMGILQLITSRHIEG